VRGRADGGEREAADNDKSNSKCGDGTRGTGG
jgi:hypothetical protein